MKKLSYNLNLIFVHALGIAVPFLSCVFVTDIRSLDSSQQAYTFKDVSQEEKPPSTVVKTIKKYKKTSLIVLSLFLGSLYYLLRKKEDHTERQQLISDPTNTCSCLTTLTQGFINQHYDELLQQSSVLVRQHTALNKCKLNRNDALDLTHSCHKSGKNYDINWKNFPGTDFVTYSRIKHDGGYTTFVRSYKFPITPVTDENTFKLIDPEQQEANIPPEFLEYSSLLKTKGSVIHEFKDKHDTPIPIQTIRTLLLLAGMCDSFVKKSKHESVLEAKIDSFAFDIVLDRNNDQRIKNVRKNILDIFESIVNNHSYLLITIPQPNTYRYTEDPVLRLLASIYIFAQRLQKPDFMIKPYHEMTIEHPTFLSMLTKVYKESEWRCKSDEQKEQHETERKKL